MQFAHGMFRIKLNLMWLGGPGIEFRWGRDFPIPSKPALGTTRPPINGYWVFLRGVKWPGRGVGQPLTLAPRLKKEYSYTSSPPLGLRGVFWDDLYLTLTPVLPRKVNPIKNEKHISLLIGLTSSARLNVVFFYHTISKLNAILRPLMMMMM
jgi:hypothetical protein